MTDRPLMKHLSNQIFETLKAEGFDPSSFRWKDAPWSLWLGTVPQLVYANTDFFFTFENNGTGAFGGYWSPDAYALHGSSNSPIAWDGVMSRFKTWLSYVKRDIETPDLWASISQEANIINAASEAGSNTPFSEDEKNYIKNGLKR